ncbi:MAG: Putative helicase [uncultured Nocardioidaceae bacterium]|uniref:Helicase n=1 Tax=uncultured Nocardioidaceae bacterium TaxID=253824 RepID=A0A6J4LI71_9ACTN|nr:MAG: Putative helicase [uncultured Nocardioidaceae bacterium]
MALSSPSRDAVSLVERLTRTGDRRDRLTHLEELPARAARHAEWPAWAPPELLEALGHQGVHAPWTHQRAAADLAHDGRHVVLATGTASGKSIGYLLPALTSVLTSRGANGGRGATVLYVSPTKALAQDQLDALLRLGLPDLRATTHDGDSPREQRDWARDHGEYLLTNPDMLHRSMLPSHARWARYLSSLDYVVVDECHHYRGVFGAHVAQVLRRLRRLCALYGASPTFVLASATVAEPERSASRLTGLPVVAVTDDGSPRGRTALALWEPPFSSRDGENDAPVRRSTTAEIADLLADLVLERVRTLAFIRSRRGTETVSLTVQRLLDEVEPGLSARVCAYRGGYLPEDRRSIERALRSGDLLGLAATNALELGIDVAGLDAVLMAGFPGTRAALWQQVGRAGRSGQDALGVLVARDDPLDTYLVNHPDALIGQPVEANVFDPENPYVLGPHLCAAAEEAPLSEQDLELFGPTARAAVDAMTDAGLLRRRPRGWFWTDRRRASDLADIRSTGGPPVRLVEQETGRLLGTVDSSSAHGTAHAGAVYLHQGETFLVDSLDLEESVAVVARTDPGYSTTAREVTDIAITAERSHATWGPARVSLGDVQVTHQVVSYLKRRVPSGEVLGEEPLDLPERTLVTTAVWWTLPRTVLASTSLAERDLPGAAHAAEHASIGLLPLFATCDRWDIGGVSTALHPDTGALTVFVYDGHRGGAGFAERGFHRAQDWLTATREAISSCRCEDGCPSCVQSPKCGNGNHPLDKAAAIELLDLLLTQATTGQVVPRPVSVTD